MMSATDILEPSSSAHRQQTPVSASPEEVEAAMKETAELLNLGIYWEDDQDRCRVEYVSGPMASRLNKPQNLSCYLITVEHKLKDHKEVESDCW